MLWDKTQATQLISDYKQKMYISFEFKFDKYITLCNCFYKVRNLLKSFI